ncbi:MAG: RNA polymerase sigma factor [Candidatus Thorarchaeota archaeon]|jgi:RNA polymerase sigma factor (sigma-70 family)
MGAPNVMRKAAEAHFREHGDKVAPKAQEDVHASYVVNRGDLTRYAYSRLKDWMDAEDAVQDAYVEMLAYTNPEHHGDFGALYKIALDRCIGRVKKAARNKGMVIVSDFVVDEETGETAIDLYEYGVLPDQMYQIQERVNLIMLLTNKMRPRTKHLIRRSFILGYTPNEISAMMGVDTIAVNMAVMRFNRKLERYL